ncbi:helix-turn-helix transcriptional regulator [Vibrio sp. NFV-1]|uniref:Helix-turn-helix transcriptional regulator n=1 Tax=Vibrio nitrifigilis TaxID=2789781 RepID=A0ABS0GJI9_9VIBR|nr:helix-turn-helix transcriptional regulator [Vibrio nitrifigilis]
MIIDIESFKLTETYETPWHEHQWGQLYWLENGIINVETGKAQWSVTPGSVGWTPKDCNHKVKIFTAVQVHVLNLDYSSAQGFPAEPGVYCMNGFLDTLLQRAIECGNSSYPDSYISHLVALLAFEVARLQELPLGLPLPIDRRARNIADELLKSPSSHLSQEQLASHWGVSVRTLSRIFIKQTGLTFSQWRQQSKIITSLALIEKGLSINEVAAQSGYTNVSAYIEAFRQRFGETPGKFQAKMI